MIENFENIESLINKIKEDKKTKNITQKRFPVRYIFLSNFETLKKLVSEIKKIGIEIFEISQLLPKDDGWISTQEFIEKIKSLNSKKDYLLLPFSEIARFYNKQDFNNLFSQLTELENVSNTNQRLYIPLLGIKDRFNKEFYQNFNRRIEYSFTWEINEAINRAKVFLYNDILTDVGSIQTVKGTKEWLNLWKKDLSSPTLCLSKTLYFLSDNAKPDEIFEFVKITNIKELISNVFDLEIPIEYKDSEKEFWNKLIQQLNKKKYTSFFNLVKEITNVSKINVNNFLELWLTTNRNEFEKWLLKEQLLSHECINDAYLCRVLSNLESFDDSELLKELWLHIFSINNPSTKIFEDRFNLLKKFYSIKVLILPQETTTSLKQKIESIKERTNRLKYITGILEFEKELIIKDFSQKEDVTILNKYPELLEYIDDFDFENLKQEQNWVFNYFKAYKFAKLKNEYTKNIATQINELNKNEETFFKWYYSFDEVGEFINENYDYVFWIDALGVEWVSLAENILKRKKYNIERKLIARVNLPSITEKNRYENTQYIQDFDKFIHNNNYQYPESIIGEIEKLKNIFDKIVIEKNKKAIIISDHGLSALVRLNDSSKQFPKAEHEGRYVNTETSSSFQSDINYIVKDNYIIASRHISLSTKPTREVHGGCTPEEVLVPIIVFNSIENYQTETYQINLLTNELDIKEPVLKVNISPIPSKKAYAFVNSARIELIKQDNNQFLCKLPVKRAGEQKLKIIIGNYEREFTINIKSGFRENELF